MWSVVRSPGDHSGQPKHGSDFVNYDKQLRNFPLVREDLGRVLTVGAPATNSPAAAPAAFTAGVNFLRAQFPGGAPGHALPRNANQYLGLAKVDFLLSPKHTLSLFYNQLWASGHVAIQTPLVLGNVGRNGTGFGVRMPV